MSTILSGIYAASMSVLKADLSLDIKETINHVLFQDPRGPGGAHCSTVHVALWSTQQ